MPRFHQLLGAFREIGFSGLFDIAIVTLVLYTLMVVLKRTRRSGLIFAGILIVGALYLAAQKFNLALTVALLQGFFAVFLVAVVVIFQEDLRYFFERIALWWLERRLPLYKRKAARLPRHEVEILARTLGDLARARVGALVVLRGRDVIVRHINGGEEVNGLISEPLLKSIFDPHSLGHDGAVIVEGNRIERLGAYLPLSKNLEKLHHCGTRHAAALGLSERSDVLCLVVSEERGEISAARHGDLHPVADAAELAEVIEAFYAETAPRPHPQPWVEFFRRNYREKIAAFALAVLLWVAVVYRAQLIERTLQVPVDHGLLPAGLIVSKTDPATVHVTFAGPRKAFLFLRAHDVRLTLPMSDARPGQQWHAIDDRNLSFPKELDLEDIEPRQVRVEIETKPPDANNRTK